MDRVSENIQKLREIVDRLPAYPVNHKSIGSCFEVDMEKGSCFGWDLLNCSDITVSKFFNSKGSIFPNHHHDVREWVIVFKGQMDLIIGDDRQYLGPGSYAFIAPNVVHKAEFGEDCSYLAITIPQTKDWGA